MSNHWNSFQTQGNTEPKPAKAGIQVYLAVLIMTTVVGIASAYFLIMYLFSRGGGTMLVRSAAVNATETTMLMPGIVGGVIGFCIGASICFKIFMSDRADSRPPKTFSVSRNDEY